MKFPRMASLAKLFGASLIFAAVGTTHAAPCGGLANCGFDDALGAGNWVSSGAAERVGSPVRTGGNSLRAAGDAGDGRISQLDLDGNTIGFDLEFWLRFGSSNTTLDLASSVTVTADGSGITVLAGTPDNGWTPFRGFTDKVTDGWELAFAFTDPVQDDLFMEDVTLTARSSNGVPEPGSLLLVGAALASVALLRRRRTS